MAGQSDLIKVGGTANLAGTVVVDTMDGYKINYDYTILTAEGGFNGTQFTDNTPAWNNVNNYAFVRPVISYDPTTVFLTVQRNDVAFASVAETPNQVAVANALETMGGSQSELYEDVVLRLTAQEAPTVYNALSGDIYASAQTVMINQTQHVRDAVTGRLQQAFGGKPTTPVKAMGYAPSDDDAQMNGYYAEPESTYGAWGYAYGSWSELKGNSNTGKIKSDTGGFIAGFDGALSENWRVGALAGYGYTSFDNDQNASGNANAYTLGAYAGGQWDISDSTGWALRSGLAYTWNTPEVDRTVSFGSFYDQLNGSYDANTFQAFGEVAFQYQPADQMQLEPYANLSYVNLNNSSFNESGASAAALGVHSDTMNTYFSTLGMRASTGFDIGTTKAEAYLDAGWRHAYGDIDPTSTAALTGSSPFTVSGVPVARDTAVIGVGMDFNVNEMTSIGLGYEGQFGDSYTQNSVTARLDIRF
ncbi:autotransporter outer membrane beta-barrel domain-containing protein [Martelella mediterranea]|uniref:Outer membrane autotransporter protein n=1 Tax=Martelella mediterranea TaxID=293089 RepID=A0A4R3NXI1_9HYPH|nr:autotransporter domain-containing protein [Martelella mediterranea]TCT44465.1 outer membrane autotransporter protein [Martelella mediterranea]